MSKAWTIQDILNVPDDECFDTISLSKDHVTCMVPDELIVDDIKEKETKSLWYPDDLKRDLRNSCKALEEYLFLLTGSTVRHQRVTKDIWELSKTNFLAGAIEVLILDEEELSSPLTFKSSNNWYMIAPLSPSVDDPSNKRFRYDDVDMNELPPWLYEELSKERVKVGLEGSD